MGESDQAMEELCRIVEEAIRSVAGKSALSGPILPNSRMGEPPEWDSLSFVSVFNAIATAYEVDLEDDDAIRMTSIEGIHNLIVELG